MRNIFLFSVLVALAASGCDSSTKPKSDGLPPALPESLAYLGQDPPGLVPERFPPAELLANEQWFWHGSPSFSPDGREMYWVKYMRDHSRMKMFYVEVIGDAWSEPQLVPFDNEYNDNNPVFSFDGQKLFFVSDRPGGFIFVVSRTEQGWSNPQPLDIPTVNSQLPGWQFFFAKDGTLYLELWADYGREAPDLYSSEAVGGEYSQPGNMGANINTDYNEFAPYVDPDEDHIIFVSNRPGGYGMHDLYVSFREQDGAWGEAINMGPIINSDNEDTSPLVSPDGRYFFYQTARAEDAGYNPYWVDAQVIRNLRPPK